MKLGTFHYRQRNFECCFIPTILIHFELQYTLKLIFLYNDTRIIVSNEYALLTKLTNHGSKGHSI